jgi:hypothetical protein
VTTDLNPGDFLRPRPPEEGAAYYGLPGDVARELSTISAADPMAILLTFLTMFGNAIGPQPHVQAGSLAPQPARLFTLLVGDAATGRKGTSWDVVAPLFQHADPEWSDRRIYPGLASPEALIIQLARGDDCRMLVKEGEFARLLGRIARSEMSTALRNAYDGSKLAVTRADPKKCAEVTQHHVSLIGHITPKELQAHHGRLREAGGLERRMLFGYVTAGRDVSMFDTSAAPADLAERVRHAVDFSHERVLSLADPITRELCLMRGVQPDTVMPVAEDVRAKWQMLVTQRLPDVDHDLGDFFNAGQTHVLRLALTYALADGATEIRQEHIRAALGVWAYCAKSAEVIFSIALGGLSPAADPKRIGQLFTYLRNRSPEWVPRADIGEHVFRNNIKAKQISAMIGHLSTRVHIDTREVATGGRPRTEYRLVPRDKTFPVFPSPSPNAEQE